MIPSMSLLTTCLLSIRFYSAVAQNPSPGSTGSTGSTPAATSPTTSITSLAAGLSTSCQTAAGSLLTSDLGTCANIIGLASAMTGTGSVIAPINSYITSICSADPCPNSTLTSAKQTIDSGCSADAQKGSPVASGLISIIGNFGSVRAMLCSQYVSNSTFCVPSLLENIQAASGTNLTIATVFPLLTGGFSASAFAKVPPSAYCNDCGHAVMTLAAPLTASSNASMTASMAANHSSMDMSPTANHTDSSVGVCGASFNDGKVPSTVRSGAKEASAAASNAQNSAGVRESVSFASALFATLASFLLYLAC